MKILLTFFVLFFSSPVVARVIYVDECTIPFDFTIANFCVLGTLGLWIIVPLLFAIFFGGFGLIFGTVKNFISSLFSRNYKPKNNKQTNETIYDSNGTHVIKNCPNCKVKMRLPIGRVGTITCPSCQRKVYTSTK